MIPHRISIFFCCFSPSLRRVFIFLLSFGILIMQGPKVWSEEAPLPFREITVKIAATSIFQFDPEWQRDVRDRLAFVSKVFESLFNIHFKIILDVPWEIQDETRETDLLMEELRSQVSMDPNQIIIGFHKMSQPFGDDKMLDHDRVGSAQYFKGLIVIRDPFVPLSETGRNIVLLHEVAHLFGAVHISDANAVMNATLPAKPELTLDETNQEVIRTTRDVDFIRGLDSLSGFAVDTLIQIYEKKIRENPHSDFYDQLGRFYQISHQPAKAVSIWEEALQYHFDNPHIHYQLGMYYFQNSRYERAVTELGSAAAHFVLPSQKKILASTLNLLGVAYFERGNTELAIFNWLKGLSANPEDLTLQGNLALAYLQNGDLDRAITEMEKLAAKQLNDFTTLSNLGAAYLRNKQADKAAPMLEKALELKKIKDQTPQKTAESSTLQGKLSEDAPEGMIRLNLGAAYMNLGRYPEAVKELEAARNLDAENAEVHLNLGQAYLKMGGSTAQAVKEIEEALRYKKDDPGVYAILAYAYSVAGETDQAVQAARLGIKQDPRTPLAAELHRNIAGIYFQKERYSEALEELNQALSIKWKDAESHYLMGLLQLRTGKQELGIRSLKTAVEINPKHSGARELLKKIEDSKKA